MRFSADQLVIIFASAGCIHRNRRGTKNHSSQRRQQAVVFPDAIWYFSETAVQRFGSAP
jgi:hypothetical protein